jgi:hypothetical protein
MEISDLTWIEDIRTPRIQHGGTSIQADGPGSARGTRPVCARREGFTAGPGGADEPRERTRHVADSPLETDGYTTNNVLRRPDNLEFVVDRRVEDVFMEEIADRDDHLPLGGREVQERKRLAHFDIEP